MLAATVSWGQPWVACQITYGAARAAAAPIPAASQGERSGHRGPTTTRATTTTAATRAICGLNSEPIPAVTPAASRLGPLCRVTARTSSQHSTVVAKRSNVVVVTKCPVTSAIPDTAVPAAAMVCARAVPPSSRAISAATSDVAAAASADGSRSTCSEPGARRCIAWQSSGTSGG